MEQCDKSVELLKSTGKRQGAILVELGYITPKDLFWGVKYQVKEIIYSLFQLGEGEYEFVENIPPDEVITLKISTNNLIYEGVNKINNLTRIRRDMPDAHTVFALNEDPSGIFRGIDLSPQDARILSLVDGTRNINQVIEQSRTNSFDVMRTLYVLWSTGFITQKESPEHGLEGQETISVEEILISMTEEEDNLKKRVEELYEKLPRMSPAEMLQADEKTGPEEIKRTYQRMVKEFNPERVLASDDTALKNKITVIFDTITQAYNSLKDEERKMEFSSALGRMPRKEEDTQTVLLEEQFRRGVEEFKNGNFWGAAELFKWVTKNNAQNPKAWSYLSLALSKMPHRMKDAEEALLESIKLEPYNGEHFANLGILYLKEGLKKKAERQFEKALKLDPGNAKAKKGLEQAQ
jgi:tetratricopeptide (TPR) repeat protein